MKLIRWAGENVTPSDDAKLSRRLYADGLFASVTPTHTSGTVTIPALYGMMCGRDFTTDEETLDAILATSGTITGQIYMYIDTEDPDYPLDLKIRNSVYALPTNDINADGTTYGIEIAQYTANTSEVTGVTFTANVIGGLLSVDDIVDNLTSTSTVLPLSANQGKVLNTNKEDKITITADSTSTTPTKSLVDNKEYVYSNSAITTLGITLASSYSAGFIASVVFKSPSTAPTVTLTNTGSYTIATKGEGSWSSLVLTPTASKTVTMIFNYDGVNMNVYVSEM